MKSIQIISLFVLTFLFFQACGSVPHQTVSHLGDSGDRFGDSSVAGQPFDQQTDLTSEIGFSETEKEWKKPDESSFDHKNEADIGIIFMPVSIQHGLSVTWRMLRFCERLYKNPCTHLRVQAGQPYGFPRAPVSLPGEPDESANL